MGVTEEQLLYVRSVSVFVKEWDLPVSFHDWVYGKRSGHPAFAIHLDKEDVKMLVNAWAFEVLPEARDAISGHPVKPKSTDPYEWAMDLIGKDLKARQKLMKRGMGLWAISIVQRNFILQSRKAVLSWHAKHDPDQLGFEYDREPVDFPPSLKEFLDEENQGDPAIEAAEATVLGWAAKIVSTAIVMAYKETQEQEELW